MASPNIFLTVALLLLGALAASGQDVTRDHDIFPEDNFDLISLGNLATGEVTLATSQEWRADHPSPFGWIEDLAWFDKYLVGQDAQDDSQELDEGPSRWNRPGATPPGRIV